MLNVISYIQSFSILQLALLRASRGARRRVAVVVLMLGSVYLLHIEVSNEAQAHLECWAKLTDHNLDLILHRVADEHVLYVITVGIVQEFIAS